MRLLIDVGVACWIVRGLCLVTWNLVLSAQLLNNRVPGPHAILGRRQFAFQTDPADYTALGQEYRRKSIRAEIVMLAYVPTLVLVVVLASGS